MNVGDKLPKTEAEVSAPLPKIIDRGEPNRTLMSGLNILDLFGGFNSSLHANARLRTAVWHDLNSNTWKISEGNGWRDMTDAEKKERGIVF